MELRLVWRNNSTRGVPVLLGEWKEWKEGLICVLKNGPSKGRKFLRWIVVRIYLQSGGNPLVREVLEAGEMEVLPESPL